MYTKIKKLKYGFAVIFALLFFISSTTYAAETSDLPAEITQIESGIVKIMVSCVDESGKNYYIRQGTGFIVGTSIEEMFIFTDYQVVIPSENDLLQIKKGNGLPINAKLTTHIQVLLPPDITIEATLTASSLESKYALLTPATKLSNREILRLSDSSTISRKQEVYALGYDGELSILGLTKAEAPVITPRQCAITSVERDPVQITTDLYAKSSFAGAPLLDKSGFILGMMVYNVENDSLDTIPVDTLKNLLETLGIGYMNTESNDYNVATESLIEELKNLLLTCQEDVTLNETKYSKSTLTKYKEAIKIASEVMSKPTSTKDDYKSSIDSLNKAKSNLKSSNFTYYIVELILLAAILIFAALNISQIKKCKRLQASITPSDKPSKKKKHLAALIHIETNEVIWLGKKGIRIGKDPKEVDYCIYNNPAVSRYHAAIVYNADNFYIIDNNSTNRTSINHSFVEPEKAIELNDEDFISIANVVFQFRLLPESKNI